MPYYKRSNGRNHSGAASGAASGLDPLPRVLSLVRQEHTPDLLDLLAGSPEPLRFVSRRTVGFDSTPSRLRLRYFVTPKRQQQPSRKRQVRLQSLSLNPQVRRCISRQDRREVLFSLRIAGRSGRSPGRGGYRRNYYSQFSCTR